jgi:hypothetical protein
MLKENEKIAVIRPRLGENFVDRIKAKHWQETKNLNNEQTIVWALEKFLGFEEIIKE